VSDSITRALYPDEGDSGAHRRGGRPVKGTAAVLVDGSGRLGSLSYLVPAGMHVTVGDAVRVGFGRRTAYGVVLGDGDTTKATREIEEVYGKRVTAAELEFARRVAADHFCDLPKIASRLAPRDGKGAQAVDSGPVELGDGPKVRLADDRPRRRVLLCAPLCDQTRVAAQEAAAIAEHGQVLVLAPTVDMVRRTLAHFRSGAARLDADAAPGSWKGFAAGTVRIGIGTRVAALYSAHDLAGIVVISEEHPGHREKALPYTHARDLAIERTRTFGHQVVLTTSAPTAQAFRGNVRAVAVGSVRDWPETKLFVKSADPLNRTSDALRRYLSRRERIVAVVDASPVWLCQKCMAVRRPTSDPGAAMRYPDATTCSRCNDQTVFQANWDQRRAQLAFGQDILTVTADKLAGVERGSTILFPDIDQWLDRPGFWAAGVLLSPVMAACAAVGADGAVVAMTRTRSADLDAVFTRHDIAAVAKASWLEAKQAGLPPFSRHVRVTVASESAPNCNGWPGRVLGPKRVGKEWELLVELSPAELSALDGPLSRLRRRSKVRVTVL
jgi:primosomal protein N'